VTGGITVNARAIRTVVAGVAAIGVITGSAAFASTGHAAARPGCQAVSAKHTAGCSYVTPTGLVSAKGAALRFVVYANGRVCAAGTGVSLLCRTTKGATIKAVVSHGAVSVTG
jgi:hypothetical protein